MLPRQVHRAQIYLRGRVVENIEPFFALQLNPAAWKGAHDLNHGTALAPSGDCRTLQPLLLQQNKQSMVGGRPSMLSAPSQQQALACICLRALRAKKGTGRSLCPSRNMVHAATGLGRAEGHVPQGAVWRESSRRVHGWSPASTCHLWK